MKINFCNVNEVSDEELRQWFFDMSPLRREKCRKIKKGIAQKSCIAADHLAKTMLSQCLRMPPQEIEISVTEHGKPYLKDHPIFFSYSHSNNMVVCTLSEHPVGIDVERIRPIDPSLQNRICTEGELAYLSESENEDERTLRFFRLWTRKEARFKTHGIPPRNDRSTEVIHPEHGVLYTEQRKGDFFISAAELLSNKL